MCSFRKLPLVWMLLGFWLFSCNNNGSSSLNPLDQGKEKPKLPTQDQFTLKVPTNAPPQVQGIAQTLNGMVALGFGYINQAANSEPTGSNGTWEWKATSQGLTITIKAVYDEAEQQVTWTATLNGTDQTSGTTFNNWTFLSGTTDMDGANGHITIFETNSTTVLAEIDWTTSASNERTITLTSGATTWKAVVKSDGSGSLMVMENGKKTFEASWDASGAGTWATYDATTGEQTGSGSWTA